MKIRFYNARILTMCEGQPMFTGELITDGSRIVYVGDGKNAPRGPFDREIDCEGNVLLPGFKDAHTHSAMTFLRSNADDLPLQSWLNDQVFPFEAKLQPKDIYTLTKVAILEYLTSGITGIMEMYLTPETIARACDEMGMRCVQVGGVNNFSQSPELLEKWYRELNGKSELTSFALGFHAEYTCSEELIERFAALAKKYQAPVYTHCAETKTEVEECIGRYGRTPVRFLADKGIFDYGGAGYHLVHTTEEDREILAEKHIGVVTNPCSNAKLASGIAPLMDYYRRGIPVGIGTDGPASNNSLDMFKEMYLAAVLIKLRENDAAGVPAQKILESATSVGARIMGLPEADTLAAGKLADIVMIDLDQPNMQPVNNIVTNIVYAGSKTNVKMTMIHGVIRYERLFQEAGRFHVGEDPEEIYARAGEVRDRILQ